MANDEENSDTTSNGFDESTVELFGEVGINYHAEPSKTFNRRKGIHFSIQDGVGILNVGGSTQMLKGYDEDGEDAAQDILERASAMV
jgi:hypothetical protein